MIWGKLSCNNTDCPSHFDRVCSKEGASEAKYCRDWKGFDE